MAIETMKLLNLVIEKDKADEVLKEIALLEKIHLENSMVEINDNNFQLKIDENHIEEVAGLCEIDSFEEKKDFREIREKLFELMDYLDIERKYDKEILAQSYLYTDLENDINRVYDELFHIRNRISELEKEREILLELKSIEGIYEETIDFKKVFNLEFFNVKFGTMTKDNIERLIKNYDNIYAAILNIGRIGSEEVFLIISLKEMEIETDRILRSVYFNEIYIPEKYLDFPKKMIEQINIRFDIVDIEIEGLHLRAREYDQKHGNTLEKCYSHLMLEIKVEKMKRQVAVTSNYVYITGWISGYDIKYLEDKFKEYSKKIIFATREVSEVSSSLKPPTKLKNNWFSKPFEVLIHMYGTPAYDEIDPTLFVAFAYMFLFGAMFGDLGQGLVLFLSGIFLIKRNNESFGGILKRIGLSSMAFGIIYDSVFGYEHIISSFLSKILSRDINKYFIRPIENINQMLIMAIITGTIFILISYGYSIINKLKKGDIKEGYFGRNGVVGVILFLTIIVGILEKIYTIDIIPMYIIKIIIVVAIILMLFREPISNIIRRKRRLYEESPSEYYVESGFELLETFLGMLSNSISFIRVGAFALNHVGLFMAFHTIANLIGTTLGEVGMFFLGNIIVIALEGLIVLIQGLRLVYYEMFSKYYMGTGENFSPVKVTEYVRGEK